MHITGSKNLSEQFHALTNAETSYIHAHLRDLHLNNSQARLLKYIADHPGALQKDAAAYLNRQNATVTNMLKGLEAHGYIERKIPRENERQKKLYLLPAGAELVKAIRGIFTNLEEQIEAAVPKAEQAQLISQLQAITQTITRIH
ncbi:MarR family winged helix-turn-helix transcriptional regulator [Lacticaseibacillus camelliae]|uniref:HTH marR-type domain-containing protein n=1 Tax=Lacticaseibacillus camelliae DSM 22697 = JCM 13995 TaxID=1423730 RepID=A0A0R2FB85_9LACO|nr:MarR family transcriptional regulator [Lacticaseibacillus camelliae]KRN25635.1 hypothetical protein FC75_GL000173 [Lacticaseibacillus camelliae DSM 22697 = JCM 13995]